MKTPATPLPWNFNGYSITTKVAQRGKDQAYIAHAANAYPKLIEALRCAENPLLADDRRALLASLGEES